MVIMTVVIFLSMTSTKLMSQESLYLGTEPDITHEELLVKAAEVHDNSLIFEEIYADSKNTYYSLSTNQIETRYEKIRVLELISLDANLVNIGAFPNATYSLFLVNNSLGKTNKDITLLMSNLLLQVHDEVSQLTDQQQIEWLQQNDKYSGK